MNSHFTSQVLTMCLIGCLFCPFIAIGQTDCESNRYIEPIFSNVEVIENVTYQSARPYLGLFDQDYQLDVYLPQGDEIEKRPLVLFQHGGAFLIGWKSQPPLPEFLSRLARHGYVVASINYRLGFNVLDEGSAVRAVYRAGQDQQAALRFLVDNQNTYGIDTSKIVVGGTSSGAIASLHTSYFETNEIPPEALGTFLEPTDLGSPYSSGNSNFSNQPVEPDAILAYWGAVLDTSYIGSPKSIPTLFMHGTEDAIVNYGAAAPFGNDATFPEMQGSSIMAQKLDAEGVPYRLYPLYGAGHEPELTAGEYVDTMIWEATDFLYEQIIRPESGPITGPTSVCLDETGTYSIPPHFEAVYCWNINSGEIIDETANQISIQWNLTGNQQIDVGFLTCIGAEGEPQALEVEVLEAEVAVDFSYDIINDSILFVLDASTNTDSIWVDFGNGDSGMYPAGQTLLYTYSEPGTYEVTITATSTCNTDTETQNVTLDFTSSLLETYDISNISIFPVPASERINFIIDDHQLSGVPFIVNDILGQEILKGNLSPSFSLNISDWETGWYILTFVKNDKIGRIPVIIR